MDFGRLWQTFLARDPQTLGQGHGVLLPLYCAISGRGEERVRRISDANETSAVRSPLFRTVTPSELPVNDPSRRRPDEIEHGRVPFVGRLLEVWNELGWIFEIRPRLLGTVVVLMKGCESQNSLRLKTQKHVRSTEVLTGCVKANATQSGVRTRIK